MSSGVLFFLRVWWARILRAEHQGGRGVQQARCGTWCHVNLVPLIVSRKTRFLNLMSNQMGILKENLWFSSCLRLLLLLLFYLYFFIFLLEASSLKRSGRTQRSLPNSYKIWIRKLWVNIIRWGKGHITNTTRSDLWKKGKELNLLVKTMFFRPGKKSWTYFAVKDEKWWVQLLAYCMIW